MLHQSANGTLERTMQLLCEDRRVDLNEGVTLHMEDDHMHRRRKAVAAVTRRITDYPREHSQRLKVSLVIVPFSGSSQWLGSPISTNDVGRRPFLRKLSTVATSRPVLKSTTEIVPVFMPSKPSRLFCTNMYCPSGLKMM